MFHSLKHHKTMAKKVFNLLVVDESGSMSCIRRQALTGMNETLETVIQMQKQHPDFEQRVTLLTFDSQHCKFHYDNTPASQVHQLSEKDYQPCASTPLYDAIGRGIAKVHAVCGEEDSVLVTIITDGWENSSMEYNLPMIQNLIEKLKKQGWKFTFIGTDNLDVEGMAHSMGILDSLAFTQDEEGTKKMFSMDRMARCCYMSRREKGEEEVEGDFFNL